MNIAARVAIGIVGVIVGLFVIGFVIGMAMAVVELIGGGS